VCSINDLKALKNPLEDQFIVFTKKHIIFALVLLTLNLGWIFLVLYPKYKFNIYNEIFHLFIISSTYAILSLIALVVITSIIWGINYIRKLKHRRSTLNSKIQNPLSKLVPQNSILRKQYLQYVIKKFCSYLLIGLMSASFVGGPLGMLSGAIPVIISSIVCSINDLKALKNPLEDQFIVFTKSYVIVVLVLLTVNFCWLLFYYLLILSY
jgi:hypothetical protein